MKTVRHMTQRWHNTGPTSATVAQHCAIVAASSRVSGMWSGDATIVPLTTIAAFGATVHSVMEFVLALQPMECLQ